MEPTNKPKTTARDFFFYLGAMILLYVSFGSLLFLLFNYVDYIFPDALSQTYYDPYASSIRWYEAILIILFPVFVYLTYRINADVRMHPEKQEIGIRKWLLYLTIFVASAIVVGDLVALVYTFLNGEVTTRFILKVITVFVLSGLALRYYTYDLHGKFVDNPMLGRWLGGAASLLVLLALVGGFFIIGLPQNQRLIRLDEQKISDLQNIQSQVVTYWQQKNRLPVKTDELKDPLASYNQVPIDTDRNEAYEYKVTGAMSFELCATFNTKSTTSTVTRPVGYSADENWMHESGRTCFTRTIDPERYPPLKKGI
jgi:hypothetical protein